MPSQTASLPDAAAAHPRDQITVHSAAFPDPGWRIENWAANRFPYFSGGRWPDRSLACFIHAGTRLQITCSECEHSVALSAERLAVDHGRWLGVAVHTWAGALRCAGCGSRRITIGQYADVSGPTFRESVRDRTWLIMARRLEHYAALAGREVEGLVDAVPRYRPSAYLAENPDWDPA